MDFGALGFLGSEDFVRGMGRGTDFGVQCSVGKVGLCYDSGVGGGFKF